MTTKKFKVIHISILIVFATLCPKTKAGGLSNFLNSVLGGIADTFGLNPEKDLYQALTRSQSDWDDAILFSERVDATLQLRYPMIEQSFLQEKCQEIAEKIIKQTPYPDLPIQVKIINNSEVNAFTTGGKYIYIHAGLLSSAPTEDALAFVISHEIGHIMAGHIKRQEKEQMFAGLMVMYWSSIN